MWMVSIRDRWGFRGCKKRQRRQCKGGAGHGYIRASQAQEKVMQGKEVKALGVVQGSAGYV